MRKTRSVIARNPDELAQVLGLGRGESQEWQVQYSLLKQLRKVVQEGAFTHAEVAKKAGSSRSRVTSILNGNLDNVSSDLLIRLLSSLGYRIRVTGSRVETAA